MADLYIHHGIEKMRCGYTTGSCAAAAAKAAAVMLFRQKKLLEITLMTPKGVGLTLQPVDIEMTEEFVSCGIVKDSGDDPDVTNGITVYAKVSRTDRGILVKGGIGVGIVTKEGLEQPVGSPAINATPRKMIEENVREVMEEEEYKRGLLVEIMIPEGVEIAKKTFNPRLGIEGGISVLGTTGIVEPMSSSALIETIRLEENMLRVAGRKYMLLTLGNYGKSFLRETMPELAGTSVTCSNFIGEALQIACTYEFAGVLLVGHIGKLVKVGAGIMNTHSDQADARMDVLMSCGVRAGMESGVLKQIEDCITVEEALTVLQSQPLYDRLIEVLMQRIEYYLEQKVKDRMSVGAVVFSNRYGILGKTARADEIRKKIREETDG